MANVICDPNALAQGAKCFASQCLSNDRRKAVFMFLLAKELVAYGFLPDYTLNLPKLLADSKSWRKFTRGDFWPVLLQIFQEEVASIAADAGVPLPANTNALVKAARCFECIPSKDAVILYLLCQMSGQR